MSGNGETNATILLKLDVARGKAAVHPLIKPWPFPVQWVYAHGRNGGNGTFRELAFPTPFHQVFHAFSREFGAVFSVLTHLANWQRIPMGTNSAKKLYLCGLQKSLCPEIIIFPQHFVCAHYALMGTNISGIPKWYNSKLLCRATKCFVQFLSQKSKILAFALPSPKWFRFYSVRICAKSNNFANGTAAVVRSSSFFLGFFQDPYHHLACSLWQGLCTYYVWERK